MNLCPDLNRRLVRLAAAAAAVGSLTVAPLAFADTPDATTASSDATATAADAGTGSDTAVTMPDVASPADAIMSTDAVPADAMPADTGPIGTPGKTTCATACGKFFGEKTKGFCNCDVACIKYKDCCDDFNALCGAMVEGKCDAGQCTGVGKLKDGTKAICSCNPDTCTKAENCCGGFDPNGCAPAAPPGSCKGSDCQPNSQGTMPDGSPGQCYCDESCAQTKDCCADKDKFCGGTAGGDTGKGDASSCTAQCTGKACGADDGCGGSCTGKCDGGGLCVTDTANPGKKICKGGTAPADTSSGSADSGAGTGGTADAGAVKDSGSAADAAKTTTTGTGTATKSSGCTAGSRAGNGWIAGLLALMAAVVLRRRFA